MALHDTRACYTVAQALSIYVYNVDARPIDDEL